MGLGCSGSTGTRDCAANTSTSQLNSMPLFPSCRRPTPQHPNYTPSPSSLHVTRIMQMTRARDQHNGPGYMRIRSNSSTHRRGTARPRRVEHASSGRSLLSGSTTASRVTSTGTSNEGPEWQHKQTPSQAASSRRGDLGISIPPKMSPPTILEKRQV